MKYEKPEIAVLVPAIRSIQSSKTSGTPDNECPGHPNNDLPTACPPFGLDE
jgi:hypothetical protein